MATENLRNWNYKNFKNKQTIEKYICLQNNLISKCKYNSIKKNRKAFLYFFYFQ